MNEITTIITQYSAGELILIIIILLFAFRALNDLLGYFWEKIRKHFSIENDKNAWQENVTDTLADIKDELKILHEENHQAHLRQKNMDNAIALVQERLQENTRSFIIDKHHKFVYDIKAIDDLNLQAMERRYLYYKTAGGDTFIDKMMDEVRSLPRITSFTSAEDDGLTTIERNKLYD